MDVVRLPTVYPVLLIDLPIDRLACRRVCRRSTEQRRTHEADPTLARCTGLLHRENDKMPGWMHGDDRTCRCRTLCCLDERLAVETGFEGESPELAAKKKL